MYNTIRTEGVSNPSGDDTTLSNIGLPTTEEFLRSTAVDTSYEQKDTTIGETTEITIQGTTSGKY